MGNSMGRQFSPRAAGFAILLPMWTQLSLWIAGALLLLLAVVAVLGETSSTGKR